MSIREHRVEVTPEASDDSALRKLDVAEGRERHLREQVELLEARLLDAEKEISALMSLLSKTFLHGLGMSR